MDEVLHQPYDITIKSIFSDITDDMMAYFMNINIDKAEELNIEFTHVERRDSDMIYKCIVEDSDVAVHLEFQSGNDKKMPYRMLRYALEIIEKYSLPVYQAVIYMGKDAFNMADGIAYNFGDNNRLEYNYRLIDLGKIKFDEITRTPYYDLYALLPLMDRERRRQKGEEYLIECTKAIAAIPIDLDRKKEIAFKAEIFSGIVFGKEIIERIFEEVSRMLNLQESETYKMILEKGMAQTIIKQLRKKLNGLPAGYEERILAASCEQLDTIAENIFNINGTEDLDKFLE